MSIRNVDVFLGRQPILNRQSNVVAYELLFRSGLDGPACVTDDAFATAHVITNAFQKFGIHAVVGKCNAFINVDGETLMSSAVTDLPPDRVVIELLETIQIDRDIVRRCRALKRLGYRLALDDVFRYSEEYEPLLKIVDIVKIDILMLEQDSLAPLVEQLRLWPPQLLAEKVESLPCARECRAMGFNLFQGFFFARPVTLIARSLLAGIKSPR